MVLLKRRTNFADSGGIEKPIRQATGVQQFLSSQFLLLSAWQLCLGNLQYVKDKRKRVGQVHLPMHSAYEKENMLRT